MPRNPSPTPTTSPRSGKLNVVIAGGGVAALETALALADLAPDHTEVTVIAPNSEFVYRPMVVREPFAYGAAHRYPLESIVHDAGATLLRGELGWIDPATRTIHTKADEAIEYDALVLALGASVTKRYPHALTIDDHDLARTMRGLIQDVEGGYVHKLAFVAPGRMAWPLPLYELALMTAGRAYDMGIELRTTIVTPEDSPLAIFGSSASSTVAELLADANVETINSAYAEVPSSREVVINPGDRRFEVDRVIALPRASPPGHVGPQAPELRAATAAGEPKASTASGRDRAQPPAVSCAPAHGAAMRERAARATGGRAEGEHRSRSRRPPRPLLPLQSCHPPFPPRTVHTPAPSTAPQPRHRDPLPRVSSALLGRYSCCGALWRGMSAWLIVW